MKLIFATHNENKVHEIKNLIPKKIKLLSLHDIGFENEIIESGDSLNENALIKAKFINSKYRLNCFADDTGLEVYSLNNEPGVYSSRYAGYPSNNTKNIKKLLYNLSTFNNKSARFRTVLSLIIDKSVFSFEGVVNGRINDKIKGSNGFGYDSIFIPKGFNKTFAELSLKEKNSISHRSIAIKKMILFLKKNY
ncbi:MAG: RdgB/HAM1 family non-canonical purine NTP pyrophosphatase [Flavobacteriaceae bacterium]|tara:strand:+ start:188 stop:766 length:579 start_codon:yes stop_codon:yes gene_type:complete